MKSILKEILYTHILWLVDGNPFSRVSSPSVESGTDMIHTLQNHLYYI